MLVAVALGASGCGQSEKDKYIDDYKPLNDRLLRIGVSVGTAPLEAGGRQSSQNLAMRFGKYATDLDGVKKDIAKLDTPGDLEAESMTLTSSIEAVVEDLKRISSAARRGDERAVARATRTLATDSARVNFSQNRLARATGADVGPR